MPLIAEFEILFHVQIFFPAKGSTVFLRGIDSCYHPWRASEDTQAFSVAIVSVYAFTRNGLIVKPKALHYYIIAP